MQICLTGNKSLQAWYQAQSSALPTRFSRFESAALFWKDKGRIINAYTTLGETFVGIE
jgi:hypothetical protein